MSATSPTPAAARARIWSFLVGRGASVSSADLGRRWVWVAMSRLLGRPPTRSNPDAESGRDDPQGGVDEQPEPGPGRERRDPGDQDGQDGLPPGGPVDQPDPD